TAPQGRWDGQIRVDGRGRNWRDMAWDIRSQRLAWEGKQPVVVENFTARVAQRGDQIALTGVDWPGHQLAAEGQYNLADKRWLFRLSGREAQTQTPVQISV